MQPAWPGTSKPPPVGTTYWAPLPSSPNYVPQDPYWGCCHLHAAPLKGVAIAIRTENSQSYVISTTEYHRLSFFPCMAREWYHLPQSTVMSPTPDGFKTLLRNVSGITHSSSPGYLGSWWLPRGCHAPAPVECWEWWFSHFFTSTWSLPPAPVECWEWWFSHFITITWTLPPLNTSLSPGRTNSEQEAVPEPSTCWSWRYHRRRKPARTAGSNLQLVIYSWEVKRGLRFFFGTDDGHRFEDLLLLLAFDWSLEGVLLNPGEHREPTVNF